MTMRLAAVAAVSLALAGGGVSAAPPDCATSSGNVTGTVTAAGTLRTKVM